MKKEKKTIIKKSTIKESIILRKIATLLKKTQLKNNKKF